MTNGQLKQSRMDRKKNDMRNKIIETTIRLVQTKGFEATTMEQIAEEADIAKKTLYNYYPEKEAIISDYIKKTFETLNPFRLSHLKTMEDTRARVIYILNNLMDGVRAQKEIFEKYLVYIMKQVVSFEPEKGKSSGIGTLITAMVELGIQEGDISNDLPLTMAEDFFIFVFIEAAKQFYLNPENFIQSEVIEKCAELFINGVKPANKQGVY